ncbi:MAG TPA: signal peptidase II [Solirubrobacterales bacterium]
MSAAAARAWRLSGALCLVVLVLDQIAKAVVEDSLVPGEEVEVLGPIGLTLAHNSGVAFGLASGGDAVLIVFALAALAVVGYLLARDPRRPGLWVAAGLVAGGALGNLVDRVRTGVVTDYLDIGSWPPFNIADVAITIGVVIFAWAYLREDA